jgi:hypothetical protein
MKLPLRRMGRFYSCCWWWCLGLVLLVAVFRHGVSAAWVPPPQRRHFWLGSQNRCCLTHGPIGAVGFHPTQWTFRVTSATQETRLYSCQSSQDASVVVERGDGGSSGGISSRNDDTVERSPQQQQLPQYYHSWSIGRVAALVLLWSTLLAAPLWTSASSWWQQQPPMFTTAAALAAPPIAIIAEELGYFPITQQSDGDSTDSAALLPSSTTTIYVPARVKRASTRQAVALADYLQAHNVRMAGAFWCPHCRRQREVLGAEAWSRMDYVECAPLGYKGNPALCNELGVTAYPTWIVPTTPPSSSTFVEPNNDESVTTTFDTTRTTTTSFRLISGERTLVDLAAAVGYPGPPIDGSLEAVNAPPQIGNSACPQ